MVSINSTTVLISWSPPFTLEGVPILGYNVTITNTTSGENETMSVEGDTTMLYYSIDHPDPDNNFTVTVVPINVAGPGESAVIVFVFLPVDQSEYSMQLPLNHQPTLFQQNIISGVSCFVNLASLKIIFLTVHFLWVIVGIHMCLIVCRFGYLKQHCYDIITWCIATEYKTTITSSEHCIN